MRELKELKKMIEVARMDLDRSMETECFDVYYKKSVELDRLIEKYLDAKEAAEMAR